jgi:hypothetical protein
VGDGWGVTADAGVEVAAGVDTASVEWSFSAVGSPTNAIAATTRHTINTTREDSEGIDEGDKRRDKAARLVVKLKSAYH